MSCFRRLMVSLLLALIPVLGHAQPSHDPEVLDLSGWVQIDVLAVYGDQWAGGINPAHLNWSPPDDGRAFAIKAYSLNVDRWVTEGDPPTTRHFGSFTDIAFEFWIGDDQQLHYFGSYSYEDSTGTLIDDNYLGMYVLPAGQTVQQAFAELARSSLPTDRAVFQAVTSVPEPAVASLLLLGLAGLAGRRLRVPRHCAFVNESGAPCRYLVALIRR